MPSRQPADRQKLELECVEIDGDWSILGGRDALIQGAAAAISAVPGLLKAPSSAVVAFSTDSRVKELNTAFRGQPKPTNVLSFPSGHATPDGALGDIVLALETVLREAEDGEIPLAHHVQHLVVHGVLHLIGFDHETASEADAMEELEIRILATLGVANPYTGELESGNIEPGNLRS